ncbi:MAG: FAD/NAD(P)-binding protein [Gaiellales bacterium]
MRVAIVGFGPKGLFALERLLDHVRTLEPGTRLEVDLFEPHPSPAAGPSYDPTQPPYLRMNIAGDLLDMWWPESRAVPAATRRSFTAWRDAAGERDEGAYPSRAQVGRYLSAGFEALLEHAPRSVMVRLRASTVDGVSPGGRGWDVTSEGTLAGSYDEVLVATGHVHGSPFPLDRWLSLDRVPAGATVAVRGFALTFIDVALALTEGRAACDAASAIVPFSRTGRPMLAKPSPAVAAAIPGIAAIAEHGSAEILALDGRVDLRRDLLPILARTAGDGAAAWLSRAASGVPVASDLPPAAELERSLAIGSGNAAPDLSWALGHSWRALYPAIVERLGGSGLETRDWPAFRRLAAELERVAFGPSPANAERLLALIRSGRVDLDLVAGGRLVERDGRLLVCATSGERAVDAVVDAVLPGPGVPAGSDGLVARLVSEGHARILRFRRGIEVDPDGSCIGRDGSRSHGLAAIGRPTEDCVIGNDTLSRTLHPLADRWGRRVAERCRAATAEPALS